MTEELAEFERCMEHLCAGLGHTDRQVGLRGYCTGLMAPLKRKSVEPMAAHLALVAKRSRHQSPNHFLADSTWQDADGIHSRREWAGPPVVSSACCMSFTREGLAHWRRRPMLR